MPTESVTRSLHWDDAQARELPTLQLERLGQDSTIHRRDMASRAIHARLPAALGGGTGYLLSQGAVKEIEWRVEDGKLVLIDVEATKRAKEKAEQAKAEAEEAGEEVEESEEEGPVEINASLYPGKTWIGWISSNNGGKMEIMGSEDSAEE